MKITFRADAHQTDVRIEGIAFERGQSRELDDELGAEILRNGLFVDASGRNPNYDPAPEAPAEPAKPPAVIAPPAVATEKRAPERDVTDKV